MRMCARPAALFLGDSLRRPCQKLLDSEVSSEVCTSPSSKPLPGNADAEAWAQGWSRSLPKLGVRQSVFSLGKLTNTDQQKTNTKNRSSTTVTLRVNHFLRPILLDTINRLQWHIWDGSLHPEPFSTISTSPTQCTAPLFSSVSTHTSVSFVPCALRGSEKRELMLGKSKPQ